MTDSFAIRWFVTPYCRCQLTILMTSKYTAVYETIYSCLKWSSLLFLFAPLLCVVILLLSKRWFNLGPRKCSQHMDQQLFQREGEGLSSQAAPRIPPFHANLDFSALLGAKL